MKIVPWSTLDSYLHQPNQQTVALFNPVVYLFSGFRWAFFSTAEVGLGCSLGMTGLFLLAALVPRIFSTGWRPKARA